MVKCTNKNQTVELFKDTLQFQSDSLDSWHTYLSGVADVQDVTFIQIK